MLNAARERDGLRQFIDLGCFSTNLDHMVVQQRMEIGLTITRQPRDMEVSWPVSFVSCNVKQVKYSTFINKIEGYAYCFHNLCKMRILSFVKNIIEIQIK